MSPIASSIFSETIPEFSPDTSSVGTSMLSILIPEGSLNSLSRMILSGGSSPVIAPQQSMYCIITSPNGLNSNVNGLQKIFPEP